MILLVGGEKGGTGKTTIATNLAAMRERSGEILLLDTDLQGSATYWRRSRNEGFPTSGMHCLQMFGEVDLEVRRLADKFDDIIIDAGGRDSDEIRSALLVADKAIIPVQPSQYDIWTIDSMAKIVRSAKVMNKSLEAWVVISRASTNPSVAEVEEAKEVMDDFESLGLCESIIRERIAYRKAARYGMAVCEMDAKDQKAISEIDGLYKEVFDAG